MVTVNHDADTEIVKVALQLARNKPNVTVVAEDTDILVLLVHHHHESTGDIYMMSAEGLALTFTVDDIFPSKAVQCS